MIHSYLRLTNRDRLKRVERYDDGNIIRPQSRGNHVIDWKQAMTICCEVQGCGVLYTATGVTRRLWRHTHGHSQAAVLQWYKTQVNSLGTSDIHSQYIISIQQVMSPAWSYSITTLFKAYILRLFNLISHISPVRPNVAMSIDKFTISV